MPAATRALLTSRLSRRLPRGARIVGCAIHGHRWDVAPGRRPGHQLECVRCGLHADAAAGLGG